MCRSLTVLCVAPDGESLLALKRAAVASEWELAPGATTRDDALAQLESEQPHVMVVFGSFEGLVREALDRWPGLRVVADREGVGVGVVVASAAEIREAVVRGPRPPGPVRM